MESTRSACARVTVGIDFFFKRKKSQVVNEWQHEVEILFGGFIFYEVNRNKLKRTRDRSVSNWNLWRAAPCFSMLAYSALTVVSSDFFSHYGPPIYVADFVQSRYKSNVTPRRKGIVARIQYERSKDGRDNQLLTKRATLTSMTRNVRTV